MLRDASMAGLVKLRRGIRHVSQRRLWADREKIALLSKREPCEADTDCNLNKMLSLTMIVSRGPKMNCSLCGAGMSTSNDVPDAPK